MTPNIVHSNLVMHVPKGDSVFGFEKPEHSLGFLLWRIIIDWQRCIKKALEPRGITHVQFVIMAVTMWLAETKQATTQIAIIRQSALDKMTVSASLKKLVAYGLVKRNEHKQDTRAKVVSLTAKGKALISGLVPIIEAIDAEFFGVLDKNEQRSLLEVFNKLSSESAD
jgi:DNA-binding MarR family transcriptional regulator